MVVGAPQSQRRRAPHLRVHALRSQLRSAPSPAPSADSSDAAGRGPAAPAWRPPRGARWGHHRVPWCRRLAMSHPAADGGGSLRREAGGPLEQRALLDAGAVPARSPPPRVLGSVIIWTKMRARCGGGADFPAAAAAPRATLHPCTRASHPPQRRGGVVHARSSLRRRRGGASQRTSGFQGSPNQVELKAVDPSSSRCSGRNRPVLKLPQSSNSRRLAQQGWLSATPARLGRRRPEQLSALAAVTVQYPPGPRVAGRRGRGTGEQSGRLVLPLPDVADDGAADAYFDLIENLTGGSKTCASW